MAYLKPTGKYSLRQDWLVETVRREAGNGNFDSGDRSEKAANLSAETEFRDRAGTLKAPIPAQQVRGARTTFDPYDWVVVCAVPCEPVSTEHFPVLREFNREVRDF
jgi:hypothetical protein